MSERLKIFQRNLNRRLFLKTALFTGASFLLSCKEGERNPLPPPPNWRILVADQTLQEEESDLWRFTIDLPLTRENPSSAALSLLLKPEALKGRYPFSRFIIPYLNIDIDFQRITAETARFEAYIRGSGPNPFQDQTAGEERVKAEYLNLDLTWHQGKFQTFQPRQ